VTPGDRGRLFAATAPVISGVLHFARPRIFEAIMPPYVPAHRQLVYASGACEIAGGLGTLHPRTRGAAGLLLAATMAGVFPANVHMALHPERYSAVPGGKAALYARLPLQAAFIWWSLLARRD
jgi:uncharacterized membrane protein